MTSVRLHTDLIGQEVTILIITIPCSWPSLQHVNKTRWNWQDFFFFYHDSFNWHKLSVYGGEIKQCIWLTHVNITMSKHKQTHSTARILPVLDCDPVYTKCRRQIDHSSRLLPRFLGHTETYFSLAILSLKGIIKCRSVRRLLRKLLNLRARRREVLYYSTFQKPTPRTCARYC